MRDDNDRSEILAQEVLKPLDGGYIEVVCRLIEQDYIWVSEKRLCKQHLDLLRTRERRHLLIEQALVKAEALNQLRRIGLRLPAVELGELLLEHGGAHSVLLAEIRLLIERVLFFHYIVEAAVAHYNGVEHDVFVKGIVILAQHRHPDRRRDYNRTVRRLKLTAKYFQKC